MTSSSSTSRKLVQALDLLYVLVIVRLTRRDLVWINVTSRPTAEWIARQIGGRVAAYGGGAGLADQGGDNGGSVDRLM